MTHALSSFLLSFCKMFTMKTLKECGLWNQMGWVQVLTWPLTVCVLGEVTSTNVSVFSQVHWNENSTF